LPQARTFDVLGTRLAALQWGDPAGVPTIALHGWLDNAATFDRLAPQLPELNLLALDFAGHGHSSHRPEGVHYHSLLDIQEIVGIADQLGWERFNVIGHSMGAGIATELTGLFPERVRRAVMIDGFLATGGAGPAERIDDNREAILRMLGSAGRRAPVYPSVDDMIRRVTEATDQSREAAEVLVARGHQAVDGGFTWRTDPRIRFPTPLRMAGEQIDELLRRVQAPSLLIVAANGDRWYLNGLEDRQKAHGHLTVEHTGGPHHIHLEPEHCRRVGALVRDFLGLGDPAAALE
tara:strand:- start:658 stop:1533 length:876 start_codon:yes stop_codon:yes gene_type:complete